MGMAGRFSLFRSPNLLRTLSKLFILMVIALPVLLYVYQTAVQGPLWPAYYISEAFSTSDGMFAPDEWAPLEIRKPTTLHPYTMSKNKTDAVVDIGNHTFQQKGEEESLACAFPHVDPYQPEIMKIAGLDEETLHCEGYMDDLTYLDGQQLKVNFSKKNSSLIKHCKYRNIRRDPNSQNSYLQDEWEKPFTKFITLPNTAELLLVVCEGNHSETLSKSYMALVPKNKNIPEIDVLRIKKRLSEVAPSETLNIIMVGLDGISRHHYIRSLAKSYSYLMNNLSSFDLTMYTQSGANTFPNYLPLFSGRPEEEIAQWWNMSYYTDAFDIIWRDFANAGYKTFYTEDWPTVGGFHYLKKGFAYPFVHYNSRPLFLLMDNDKELFQHSSLCAGNTPEINLHFDYMERFLNTFPNHPVFAVLFNTKVTHDYMTNGKRIDEHVFNFYTRLEKKGHLNNTLLISFSDHGPRWGEIRDTFNGMVESRSPFAILTFPEWFLKKYPDVAKNLEINTRRLTSHVDVHATLLDLLYFKSKYSPPLPPQRHGISLFEEVSASRVCEDIPIPPEFCLCGHKSMEYLKKSTKFAKELSEVVLKAIDTFRDKELCAVLTVEKILQIARIQLPKDADEERGTKNIFKVKLQTSPNKAVYEATVIYDTRTKKYEVGRTIDRLNLYRGQAECVNDAAKMPFCYCKHLLKTTTKSSYSNRTLPAQAKKLNIRGTKQPTKQ